MSGTIGIYFGTDSGSTRLVGKKIAKALAARLGDDRVSKPRNVNRTEPDEMLAHQALILGTPSYGEGVLPGKASRNTSESWLEFLPLAETLEFNGMPVALYGLGDQEQYPDHFVDAMRDLHDFFTARGASVVGSWPTAGYDFTASRATVDDRFVGLALDQHLQQLLTEERIEAWLDLVVAQFATQPGEPGKLI